MQDFAAHRVEELLGRGPPAQVAARRKGTTARADVLADVLTARGYAAQMRREGGRGRAAVPASLPGRARRRRVPGSCARPRPQAFAELLGTHVQRLATIARGDAACTTHVPPT